MGSDCISSLSLLIFLLLMTPSEQLFKELNWPPFPKQVQYHTCLIVYISPQCSRMSLNTMRGKPGQRFSIYCTLPDHIQPTLTGHFQFKVQNYGIVYQRILETAHQSRELKRYLLYNN